MKIAGALSFPQDQLERFRKEVEKNGPQVAEQLLGQITKALPDITPIVNDFKDSINKAIDQARKTHDEIQKAIAEKGITMEDVSDRLSREMKKVYEDLKDKVDETFSEDPNRRSGARRDRAQLVSQIMDKVGIAYIRVLTGADVPHNVAETQFSEFSSMITRVILVAGEIMDKYPFLFGIIAFVVSIHLQGLSGSLLLRLILPLFGFGPLGPIKGSAAAWAQKVLWGDSVAPGSWFAILQRHGMTLPGGLFGKLLFESAGLVTARL